MLFGYKEHKNWPIDGESTFLFPCNLNDSNDVRTVVIEQQIEQQVRKSYVEFISFIKENKDRICSILWLTTTDFMYVEQCFDIKVQIDEDQFELDTDGINLQCGANNTYEARINNVTAEHIDKFLNFDISNIQNYDSLPYMAVTFKS